MIQQFNHYQINNLDDDILGQGTFGVVYRAYDQKNSREVAVKVLRTDPFLPAAKQAQQQKALQRFEREAMVVTNLVHDAIVPVYDFGQVKVQGGDYPYMVMRLMLGGSLENRLAQGALPLPEVVRILSWLAPALDKVHRENIIHRDLKPANILFDEHDLPALADFGIAKLTQATQKLTGSGTWMGTPAYMSPEQTYFDANRQEPLDGRSDIYAMGVILYEMLTGNRPYHEATNVYQLMYAHRSAPIPRLDEFRRDLGAGWQALIDKAMAKKPDERYATTGDLVAAVLKVFMATPPAPPPEICLPTADDCLRLGNQYYNQQAYEKAIAQYRQAMLLEPNNPLAYLNRGLAYYALGEIDNAISDYNHASRLNPQSATIFYYRGLAYQYKGLFAEALRDYDQALRINPQYRDVDRQREAAYQALIKRGQSAYQQGRLDEALADYDAALPFKPHDKGLQKLRQQAYDAKHPPLGIGSERVCPKDGMVQVYVPAGNFLMGSRDDDPDASSDEKPQHEVHLDAYWIDKTAVTNAMFSKFVQETGYQTEAEKEGWAYGWTGSRWENINGANWRHPRGPKSNLSGKDNHPVVSVSWNDANAYASWAGRRLPTEAEWEKAAGGTDGRKWPWGNNPPTDKLCNFNMNVKDTTPVGNYPAGASPYGALDMAGNVWEWCSDTFDSSYYASSPKANPHNESPNGAKVLRGGSWFNSARVSRARFRVWFDAFYRGGFRGFRCARSPSLVP